ncbi:MAG: NUDIX hydrolase [Angustibacter sp.]
MPAVGKARRSTTIAPLDQPDDQPADQPNVLTDELPDDRGVRSAGVLPWRLRDGRLEVALVHRPRYDDWSWPKGKLEPAESWPAAAVRETREETKLAVRLGVPLPQACYHVTMRGTIRLKVVRYWAARIDDAQPSPRSRLAPPAKDRKSSHVNGRKAQAGQALEVDQIAWLEPDRAHARLDYARDRAQLERLHELWQIGLLDTWPLLVIRHARTVPRQQWTSTDDHQRPLDERGRLQAMTLVPTLAAYAPRSLVTSGSARCVDTLRPYAAHAGRALSTKRSLSEEEFRIRPERTATLVDKALARGEPMALCTHRPVLPTVLGRLAAHAADDVRDALLESSGPGLVKGEMLVAHIRGTGRSARLVAVERHGR